MGLHVKWIMTLTTESQALRILKLVEIKCLENKSKIIAVHLNKKIIDFLNKNSEKDIIFIQNKNKVNITFHEEGFLVVCDRENFRVQFFDTNGSFVRQIHFHRPQAICSGKGVFSGKLIISEAGSPSLNQSNVPNLGNLIKIIDFDGKEICRFGNSLGGELPDQFISPHGITQDNDGNIYVAEVSYTAYGSKLNPPQEVVSLRKWKPKYH